MTKTERQSRLDGEKWVKSQELHADQTGRMEYCTYCDNKNISNSSCVLSQVDRENACACAKAYNRMKQLQRRKTYESI